MMTTAWSPVDSTNYLKPDCTWKLSKMPNNRTYIWSQNDIMLMLTSKGFDQENSAPDNANETQSTGVPG